MILMRCSDLYIQRLQTDSPQPQKVAINELWIKSVKGNVLMHFATAIQSKLLWILLGCYFVLWPTYAQQKSDSFVISYMEHEGLVKYYVPVIREAYRRIGIEAKFELINDKRALLLLNDGLIDADAAKTLETIDQYPKFRPLATPLSKIEVHLVCQPYLDCNKEVLENANLSLGIVAAGEFYDELLGNAVIKIVDLTSFDILAKIFEQQKVDAMVVVVDDFSQRYLSGFLNHVKVQEKLGYHLISVRHAAIADELDSVIQEIIQSGEFMPEGE